MHLQRDLIRHIVLRRVDSTMATARFNQEVVGVGGQGWGGLALQSFPLVETCLVPLEKPEETVSGMVPKMVNLQASRSQF